MHAPRREPFPLQRLAPEDNPERMIRPRAWPEPRRGSDALSGLAPLLCRLIASAPWLLASANPTAPGGGPLDDPVPGLAPWLRRWQGLLGGMGPAPEAPHAGRAGAAGPWHSPSLPGSGSAVVSRGRQPLLDPRVAAPSPQPWPERRRLGGRLPNLVPPGSDWWCPSTELLHVGAEPDQFSFKGLTGGFAVAEEPFGGLEALAVELEAVLGLPEAPPPQSACSFRRAARFVSFVGGGAADGLREAFGNLDRVTLANVRRLSIQKFLFGSNRQDLAKILQLQTEISGLTEKQALENGILEILQDAGAEFLPNSCGICAGYGKDRLAEGQVCLSSTARNFQGRMGAPNSEVYLASPYTVAASAVVGKMTDPRKLMVN